MLDIWKSQYDLKDQNIIDHETREVLDYTLLYTGGYKKVKNQIQRQGYGKLVSKQGDYSFQGKFVGDLRSGPGI